MSGKAETHFHDSQIAALDASVHHIAPEEMATVVIFGATGDLAQRKLVPAMYNLWFGGYLPKRIAVVGVARKPKTDNEFREEMCDALKKHSRSTEGLGDACDPFVGNLYYQQLEFTEDDGFKRLGERLTEIEKQLGSPGNRLYYLSVGPEFFGQIVEDLGASGLINPHGSTPWTRVVFEKPFGQDLESARQLNTCVGTVLHEEQIFRIDHYLGKETVQNIFSFRFGNAIFEPLFNQKYIDHVQITMAEDIGMEGRRGAFYDKVGAMRDVVQNHVLQLMSLVAMEPPAVFGAKEIHDEKVKVLCSVDVPLEEDQARWCVRGQYAEGQNAPGYLSEDGVAADSSTETYVAVKLYVNNWRWAGVPFLLRSGKNLKARVTEIAVQFKSPPTHYFADMGMNAPVSNTLVFRIQPDESISLRFNAKPPGLAMGTKPVEMEFKYGAAFAEELPEAYERLLLDAIRGDSTLFMRSDEIDYAWRIVQQVMDSWKDAPPPELYRPGTWGPREADALFRGIEGKWRNPA